MIVPGKIVDRTSILFAIVTHGKHTNFSQLYMSIFVFGFCRTLVRTKIQQITVRASEHNWAYSIFVNFGLAYATINRSGVNFLLSYLSSIHYTSSQFSPTPLFASASNRVRHYRQSTPPPPPGLDGHAKSYDCIAPQLPNEVDMTRITQLTSANLSTNHCAFRDAYIILHLRLQQRTPPPLTLAIIFQASIVSGINNIF